ncbi:diguanylate cyclase (GGDEF)-like protein [Roseateles toxinivorans]|uniref:Diguanylate cyclase (GGDEF)-like protein n=2 Tax=Roseateles toxinivorans TaxID=270368 RepID=A0A4R6QKM1_9BURK|nr:diguanylate cyclase (GGDEF)-like protein [Roseateles toxinivorans]
MRMNRLLGVAPDPSSEASGQGAPTPGRYSIRASLTGLVAACLAPALLVSGYLVHENYGQHRARLERDALLQARGLAAALDREFSGVVSGLRVLSTSPALAVDDLRGFHERARGALAFQIVDNYVMTDRQGRQRVNTLRDFGEPLPETGTPAELQRVFETGKPVVTDMFIGPVTGKPVIAIGVPVFRQGQVVYSLNVGLSLERIAEVLNRLAMPGHWVAAVLDGTGTIVARTRDPEKYVGQKATADVMELLDTEPAEITISSRSMEGIPTYAGLARSSVSNWSVVVGAPRSAVEAGFYRSIAWLLASAAAAFTVGLWVAASLSARISGSMRALVEPALSLGSGSPTEYLPPSRLKETEAVSRAIVQAGRMLNDARRQARHDPLTGLPNRLLFDELASNRLAEAHRHGTSLATLAIDLDRFKAVNDTHGHEAGDTVLIAAASRIAGLLRESDVVARLGGDEFVVLLGDAGQGEAEHVGGKLVAALSAPYPGVVPEVSCSVGIALHPKDGHTVAELCLHADQALYEAKRTGKRRVIVYR